MTAQSAGPSRSCHRAWRLTPILLAALGACATNEARDQLRNAPPAPLIVQLDCMAPASGAADALHFTASQDEMRTMLLEELRSLDTCSKVATKAELGAEKPDLVVTLVPKSDIRFEHAGTANFLGSGGLWLVTWIGGLLVPDSSYRIAMDASWNYSIPQVETKKFQFDFSGEEVDLSFFDRNSLLSLQGLQSLVLPPFWTSDQTEKTSTSLTRSSMQLAARKVANELKRNFANAEKSFECEIKINTPANGSTFRSTSIPISLEAKSLNSQPIGRVRASVENGKSVDLEVTPAPNANGFVVEAKGVLELQPNRENFVRIEVQADKVYTRTLRLTPR